jgi:serine/threonine-protein kinase
LNARQIPTIPSQSNEKKWIAIAVAAIIVAATVLFVTSSREPSVTTVDDSKLTMAQTTLAAAVTQLPPGATASQPVPPEVPVSKAPEGQSSMAPTKAPDGQPSIAVPTQATLAFAVLPWGEIFIDDKSQGASPPLREIRLPPGKHQIEIKNSSFPPHRQTVELEAGANKTIRHKFK